MSAAIRPPVADAMPARGPALLQVAGVHKSFGSTHALRGVDLALHAGEVHALLGENGAGKSTLQRILAGGMQPDRGDVLIDGAPTRLTGVGDAVGRGVLPIYQQLSLMEHLTVLENLLAFELARGRGLRLTRPAEAADRAESALRAVGLRVDLGTPVARLSLAQRQLVELARCVMVDSRVLLLDEPTTSLAGDEVEALFEVMAAMRAEGRALLFITHRLDEVQRICDRVTVLRDGQVVLDSAALRGMSRARLVHAMVGEHATRPPASRLSPGAPLLSAAGLRAPWFRDIDLEVREREIVAIVGLIGSGATELGQVLAGVQRFRAGEVRLAGARLRAGDRAGALRAGIGFIPVDRDRDGVFGGHSVLHNASASSLGRLARRGWLGARAEERSFAESLERLAVKPSDPHAEIGALSGGNRQKVLVARSVTPDCRVLIAQEPTRGVDLGARAEIHRRMIDAAASGMAVLVTSTDLDEVAALADRVIVMRAGRAVAELDAGAGAGDVVRHLTGASS